MSANSPSSHASRPKKDQEKHDPAIKRDLDGFLPLLPGLGGGQDSSPEEREGLAELLSPRERPICRG